MYEERRAHVPSDATELNATVLPMLMRESPIAIPKTQGHC